MLGGMNGRLLADEEEEEDDDSASLVAQWKSSEKANNPTTCLWRRKGVEKDVWSPPHFVFIHST